MAKVNVIVALLAVVGLTRGQLTFPGESDSPSTSPQESTPAASPAADAPDGQTRFFLPDVLGIFDPCSRCSINDQVEASRCCQQGNRHCCSFLAPVGPPPGAFGGFPQGGFQPGGFPQGGFQQGGFQQGGFPQGGFQGGGFPQGGFQGGAQVGPPGFGGKPGTCPFINVQSGFNRFAQTSCVSECQSDFSCPGAQKCCSVGCSSICRNPPGLGSAAPVVIPPPTTKPGFCPRPLGPLESLGSLLGLRSGAGAADAVGSTRSLADTTDGEDAAAKEGSEKVNRRKERRQQERAEREKRSPQRPDADDRRERRLNRFARIRGRVTRQAAEPDQRFFLPNPFCRDQCFNDFDCLGNLKCCIKDDCRSCVNPSFF